MLHPLIQTQVSHWLTQPHCPAKPLLDYMVQAGKLRTPQLGAIATYLYLLFEGKNQDLASLWQQGLFSDAVDYSRAPISSVARTTFETQPAANTWYQWALKEQPQLAAHWATQADQFDFKQLTQQLFYNWTNTDYLFSLPMGAGKTWLMASIFYLNLYLHSQHPDDPRYARNFAILIPSSKKSSLLPSLRSIQRFKPEWVIPQPAAGLLAAQLKFEVLDAVKSAAKSNRTRNPNAQKLAQHAPFSGCTGLVLVVNAEKVILDKLGTAPQLPNVPLAPANELRDLIGSIPNLQIHIDEVQNAADDEIKLRQVVQGWHANGSIHSVLGYSGTPYHEKPHKITVSADGESQIKLPNISTVVYHYPLITAVEQFLKQPKVITLGGMQPAQIVAQGVQEFIAHYGSTVYETDEGTRLPAKLAIYCGSISRLETEIYPQLLASGIPTHEILRYHGGNKDHPVQAGAQAQFLALDTAVSRVRIVLLVQIGKEGWDCKSLAGVILSQQGDCPTNMVLQTTCRCLREVKRGVKHSAHIWLNAANAQVLDAQLKASQQSSIAQLNAAANGTQGQTVQQVSRMAQLQLPPAVSALKLELVRHQIQLEPSPRTAEKLLVALNLALARHGTRSEDGFTQQGLGNQVNSAVLGMAGSPADFDAWCAGMVRQSFGLLSWAQVQPYEATLKAIFVALCVDARGEPCAAEGATDGTFYYDTTAPKSAVEQAVRLAFWQLGSLNYQLETIAPDAQLELLHAHKLKPLDAANVEALFPYLAQHDAILKADAQGSAANDPASQLDAIKAQTIANLIAMGMPVPPELAAADTQAKSIALRQKDRTLHYSPYQFEQSQFEKRFLEKALALDELAKLGLELYYNGDRALTGFKIECFEQTPKGGWGKVGQYTPDFLLLKRSPDNAIHQLMMIETKGAGFFEQTGYANRKRYVQSSFLARNAAHFGYQKFDFIELLEPLEAKERRDLGSLLHQLRQRLTQFFTPPLQPRLPHA